MCATAEVSAGAACAARIEKHHAVHNSHFLPLIAQIIWRQR